MKQENIYIGIIQDLIKGKLALQSPPSFSEDFERDGGTFQEEMIGEIKDFPYSFFIDFNWSYKSDYTAGDYLTPPYTEYSLDDITIQNIYLYDEGGNQFDLTVDYNNELLTKKFLLSYLPISNITKSFANELRRLKEQKNIKLEQDMKKSELKKLIKESIHQFLFESIYSFEISVRDARIAQDIFRDQFHKYGKMSSTNTFDFSDFGTAIDFAQILKKQGIEIYSITENGSDAWEDFSEYLTESALDEETGLTKKFDKVASIYKELILQKQNKVKDFVEKMKTLSGPKKDKYKADYISSIKTLNDKINAIEREFEKSVRNMRIPNEDELL